MTFRGLRGRALVPLLAAVLLAGVLLAGVLLISACGRRGVIGSRGGGGSSDSSFATLTFQRGRSPSELCLARGRILYDRYCAICHGEDGEGDGFNAYNVKAAFDVTPTAFADSAVFSSLDPDTALMAIRAGGRAVGKSAAMPPWGQTLTSGEVVDLWQWIRSLAHRIPAQ